jgi:phosphate transport system substrate-binding protein
MLRGQPVYQLLLGHSPFQNGKPRSGGFMSMAGFRTIWVLVLLVTGLGTDAQGEDLTIGGTGSVLSVMRQIGDKFSEQNPGIAVTVLPSLGSGGGIKALIAGKIDIAVSARPLKDEERTNPIADYYVGRTPIAFAVHGALDVAAILSAEILEIYGGSRRTWPDGTPIRLVLRPNSETDFKRLVEEIDGLRDVYMSARRIPGVPIAYNDAENVEFLSKINGAIGTVTLSQFLGETLPLHLLTLDGVEPSVANLQSGAYRPWKGYWYVTAAQPSEAVQQFIVFAMSADGRMILERTGHDLHFRPQ